MFLVRKLKLSSLKLSEYTWQIGSKIQGLRKARNGEDLILSNPYQYLIIEEEKDHLIEEVDRGIVHIHLHHIAQDQRKGSLLFHKNLLEDNPSKHLFTFP